MKALEKAEAKLKSKLEKRNAKSLYEGSKLMEAQNNKKSYEELFLEVNPLNAVGQSKGKSKDIQLENIDVRPPLSCTVAASSRAPSADGSPLLARPQLNFGSHRILSSATLTLPYGRRAGLIGRNGVGKSTLLRAMALREVPIPGHISILYVQQEVIGDDTPAIESVLQADVHRTRLMAEEKELNDKMEALEREGDELVKRGAAATADDERTAVHGEVRKLERKKDDAMARLGEVQRLLIDIDADSGPSRAAELLAGLGFTKEDQVRPSLSLHLAAFFLSHRADPVPACRTCRRGPSREVGACASRSPARSSASPTSFFSTSRACLSLSDLVAALFRTSRRR